jgi:O-antigen ligase
MIRSTFAGAKKAGTVSTEVVRGSAPYRGRMARQALTGTAAVLAVVALGFSSGGYFPSDWGLLLLASTLACVAALLLSERIELGRLDIVLVGALSGLAAWQLLSVVWSPGVDAPVLEAQRTLVYAAAAAALLLVTTRDTVPALLAGVAGGIVIVSLYALAARILPDKVGDSSEAIAGLRLDDPFGYANALGILAVIAILLLAGLALESARRAPSVAASASLVLLAAVLWLTLSRGAILALGTGAVGLVLVARERAQALAGLLLLAAFPAVAVLLAAGSDLTEQADSLAEAETRGHTLAWQLALLALAAAATGAVAHTLARRLASAAVAVSAVIAAALVVIVLILGPIRLAEQAADSFRAPPPVTEQDLNRRLLTLSGNWRADYWHVAWAMVEREPLVGEGGGSFERWWLQERPVASYARDAHSLYLETLAELGPVGLAVLAAALAAPLIAVQRARRRPAAAGAAAAYTAFLVHAALDWDWELPLVTLSALACGAALVVLARPQSEGFGRKARSLGVASAVALLPIALVLHVGNRALSEGEQALVSGEEALAEARARRARAWIPWTESSLQLLAEAQLSKGQRSDARANLTDVLARDPERWTAWYDLAVASTGGARAAALARAERLNPLGPEIAALRDGLRTNP